MAKTEKSDAPKPRSRKVIEADLAALEGQLEALLAEPRTDYAQGIIDKTFAEFKKGAAWTNRMKENAENIFYVYSPLGRKRRLPAGLTGDTAIISQQVRRGSNAPIQGMASEIGVKAGRVVMESYYEHLEEICSILDIEYDPWELRIQYNRMVHDANYYSVPYAMVIPFTHILQYDATYGITQRYEEEFGLKFTIEPEIEMEFGSVDSNTHTWDWSLPNIVKGITSSVDDLIELKILKAKLRDKTIKEIFEPWRNKECRKYLQKHFPLLGVPDLDEQIKGAIKPIYAK